MDDQKLKEVFVKELDEQLQLMKKSLSSLEGDALADFSRAAHTLKSSSAVMKYMQMSQLSQALEETLNKIVAQKIKITTEMKKVLSESVESLSTLAKEIKSDKIESDVSAIVEKVKGMLHEC